MLEISFARFMASMAVFNDEIAPSRRFGRSELSSMVETGGRYEETVWQEAVRGDPSPNMDERPFCCDTPRGVCSCGGILGELAQPECYDR